MKTNLNRVFFLIVLFTMIVTAGIRAYGEHHIEEIDYKKWSRLAISTVKEEYPDWELIDYQYVKREAVNHEESKDVFKIKLDKNGQNLSVKVDIIFNPKTAKLITVNIEDEEEAVINDTIILD